MRFDTAPYLGYNIAQKVLGTPEGKSAFDAVPFKAVPLYTGQPWFLPLSPPPSNRCRRCGSNVGFGSLD